MANNLDQHSDAALFRGLERKGLADLFEHALRDIYYAEKKIYKSLPAMIDTAHDAKLRQLLTEHREETGSQIEIVEQVFDLIGKAPKAERCDAINGILDEADRLLKDFESSTASDAAIIFSCQAVEHYEITRYGSMVAYARALNMPDAADLLASILHQENKADVKLTSLAEAGVNSAAA